MRIPALLKLFAAAALSAAVPAAAQVQTAEPGQPAAEQVPQPVAAVPGFESQQPQAAATMTAEARADQAASSTLSKQKVLAAAESTFGKGTAGLADMIEDLLRKQGEPSAYITGREAGGAFVVGLRYGSGTLHHGVEGDRPVHWTGPSLGFDFGGDASKVFVLVYNLYDSQKLFRRYPGAEGKAYVLGGFTANYMRRGDVVLIPVRLGVGARLGVNAGYMNFSEKSRLLPF